MSVLWHLRSFLQSRRAAPIVLSQGDGSAPPSSSFMSSPDDSLHPSLTLLRTPTRPIEVVGASIRPADFYAALEDERDSTAMSSTPSQPITATNFSAPATSSNLTREPDWTSPRRSGGLPNTGDHVQPVLSSSANMSVSVPRHRASSNVHLTNNNIGTSTQVGPGETRRANSTSHLAQPAESVDNVQNPQNSTSPQNPLSDQAEESVQERQSFRSRLRHCFGFRLSNLIIPFLVILLIVTLVITALQWREDYVCYSFSLSTVYQLLISPRVCFLNLAILFFSHRSSDCLDFVICFFKLTICVSAIPNIAIWANCRKQIQTGQNTSVRLKMFKQRWKTRIIE